MNTVPTHNKRAIWIARFVFSAVFLLNIQCAIQFIVTPELYLTAYELYGQTGKVALQGLGVAFLMWNATYPFYIYKPEKYHIIGIVILAQQAIGLVGETTILLGLQSGHEMLYASILRFIAFDGIGLLLMIISFVILLVTLKSMPTKSIETKN